MSLISEEDLIKGYLEEIKDLREALKYSKGTYFAELLKELATHGECPVCGAKHDLPDRQDAVPR
jgi:DNA repair exonuclease SbcCD ATPase subunit